MKPSANRKEIYCPDCQAKEQHQDSADMGQIQPQSSCGIIILHFRDIHYGENTYQIA